MTKARPNAPRTSKAGTFADLAAALAMRLAEGAQRSGDAFTFPAHAELDEFGFDVRTGAAGFEHDDPVRIALPPGRPRSR